MATKLTGRLILSRIPKDAIKTNDKGEKFVWIDVTPRKETGKYGDTHSIQIWTKDTGTVYLADLKPQEFGQAGEKPTPKPAATEPAEADDNDLPF